MKGLEMKKGNLRVYNIINVPNIPEHYPVEHIHHAKELIDALAKSQLLDETIISNVFGLEVFEDGEWIDWQDEDGRDLDEHFEELQILKQEA
jgi:hypothetical protein